MFEESMKILIILSWTVIFAALIFYLANQPSNNTFENSSGTPASIQKTQNNDQFPNAAGLHWTHMPLTYRIYNCTEYQSNRIVRGFLRIENETNYTVKFKAIQNDSNPDIGVYCRKDYKQSVEPGYLTSGDSAYSVSSANSNLIMKAEINFYGITSSTYSSGCTIYPDIEIHEILHGFGYGHNDSTKSIMYPSHVMCGFKIDDNIISELKKNYG